MRRLCALADIREGGCLGFGDRTGDALFAVRKHGEVYVYRNCCPHAGSPLNWMPDRFLDRDREHILCTAHGALFEIESGLCIAGPCPGASLTTVRAEIRGGDIWIDE